jgi:hypothetical protein
MYCCFVIWMTTGIAFVNDGWLRKFSVAQFINFEQLVCFSGNSLRSIPRLRNCDANLGFTYYLYVGHVISQFMEILISENIQMQDGIWRWAMNWMKGVGFLKWAWKKCPPPPPPSRRFHTDCSVYQNLYARRTRTDSSAEGEAAVMQIWFITSASNRNWLNMGLHIHILKRGQSMVVKYSDRMI